MPLYLQSCEAGCNYYEVTDSAVCYEGIGDSWDPVTKCCDCADGSMTCSEGDNWAQDGDYTTAGIPTEGPRAGKYTGFWPEYTDSVVEEFTNFYNVRLCSALRLVCVRKRGGGGAFEVLSSAPGPVNKASAVVP